MGLVGYDPPLDLFENNNNIKRKNTKAKAGIVVSFAFDYVAANDQ
jgi:hypothetical protein